MAAENVFISVVGFFFFDKDYEIVTFKKKDLQPDSQNASQYLYK